MSGTLCHICGKITYPHQSCGCAEELASLRIRVDELGARLTEEVKDRDHWRALAESLDFPYLPPHWKH